MRTFPDKEMWPSGKRYASKGRTYRLGRGDEKRAIGTSLVAYSTS